MVKRQMALCTALAAYANAGGLAEPSLSHLAQFSNRPPPNESFQSLLKH